ncbi:1-acyl-sn-glycerol-3-phosphate acyltransferase [Pseudoclavibacter sp. JAI123]|uniref:lysophospholipid acyltransferase family protein n=1 Tax=Pseudoclavibacter sp. JAI123 TaxID=2723065 RepID=UPI0015C878C8|nr:lysophospholipid acyltransferase family protein [Pseudoclavibacter sp. JAI123]NYF12361.1 1-acyl-sn-glycerol-3-phosphate acyltransferase [Pseudoclavibacter sp. JAI123]
MMLRLARALLVRSAVRDVRTGLLSIAVTGQPPSGGAVLAANHGSWWDAYLIGLYARNTGFDVAVMMGDEQLRRFPFLRLVGAVPPRAVRTLAARARAGDWSLIFPEGELRAGRGLASLHPGAEWVAARAEVPLVPVAIRVVMRGAAKPEAFVRFGAPVRPEQLAAALGSMLEELDRALDAADPARPLPGYRIVFDAQRFRRDRVGFAGRMLAFLTRPEGFRARRAQRTHRARPARPGRQGERGRE